MLTFLRAARRLRRPSSRTTIALVVAVGLITGAAVATPRLTVDRAAIRASNADFSPAVYVNMGDSLSSGEGTYDYDPTTDASGKNMCHRSPESYSEQFAFFINSDYDYTNVACSGAGTNEIGAADAPTSAGGVPENTGGNPDTGESAQVAALDRSTRLVTISIGINDVGLISGYAQACYGKSANLAAEDQCFQHLPDPAGSIPATNLSLPYTDGSYEAALSDLPMELSNAYTEIRQQAPNATVAVLTYPQIYPATYTGPCQTFGLPYNSFSLVTSQAMLDAVHTVVSRLNTVIAGEAAQFPGFVLVDESNALAGHDVCASDRWVNQINGIGIGTLINGSVDDESLHPTSDGYAAMADVLERRLDPGRYSTGAYEGPIGTAYEQDGGPQELGFPADTGAGPYVHFWEPVNAEAEDFSGGAAGPALMVEGPKGTFYVNLGFRTTYLSGANAQACGAPTDLAYASAGGTRQDFVSCYLTWTSSGGVVVHPAAANPAT
jgi:lysophospholipase L1-like esterase